MRHSFSCFYVCMCRVSDLLRTAIQQPSFEDDRDVREYYRYKDMLLACLHVHLATVDEHLQKVGAEAFNKFQRRMMNLDKEVRACLLSSILMLTLNSSATSLTPHGNWAAPSASFRHLITYAADWRRFSSCSEKTRRTSSPGRSTTSRGSRLRIRTWPSIV